MKDLTLLAASISLLIAASGLLVGTTNADEPTVETATFSMYCYWTGEATLGRVDGVVASRIGHWDGAEIVQVDYDPDKTDVGKLAQALVKQRSFYSVVVDAPPQRQTASNHVDLSDIKIHSGKPRFIEPKHSLRTRNGHLLKLDLSETQAIALNSWSYFGGTMPDVLTDDQKVKLRRR